MKFVIVFLALAAMVSQKSPGIEQVRKDFGNLKTQGEARAYISKTGLPGDILELDQIRDSSAAALKLFKASKGEVIEQQAGDKTYLYKAVTTIEADADRVQYIYFDNSKVKKGKIDSLRAVILKRISNGESFAALAKQYSMDPNGKRGGDLGWYDPAMFVRDFVNAVRAHKKDDVFTVDVPANKWYYVVRKTHNTIKRKKIIAAYIAVPSK